LNPEVRSMAQIEILQFEQRVARRVTDTDPPLTFTVEVEFVPEDNAYSAWCEEMKAKGWDETLDGALDDLADEMWDFADVMVEDHDNDPKMCDPRIAHARYIWSLGSVERVRELIEL